MEKEIDRVIEGLEIIQEQYLKKIQKQYREVKDTKDVSLFEWEILDSAIKELKRERESKQEEVQAISLDKVKKAREKIENLTPWDESTVEMYDVLEILDKLIESE